MECLRCGAAFEGRFCPRCGAPGAVPTPAWPCSRCGTPFAGNFCPACAQPRIAAYVPPAVSPPSGARSVLSVLWTIALAGFLLLVALDFAGLALAPGLIVPGIQGVSSGGTLNAGLDVSQANWGFLGTGGPSATGAYQTAGGNPSGYLETTLPAGVNVVGYWVQAFTVSGAAPFQADVVLDLDVALGSTASDVRLLVFLGSAPGIPSSSALVGSETFSQDASWESGRRFAVDAGLDGPGTYYLAIAFAANTTGPGTASVAGIDNASLSWSTAAGVFFYLAVPDLVVLFVTQDPGFFLAYFGLLLAIVLGASAYHLVRERKASAASLFAPLDAIGARLRSRSAWLTVGQVWLALTFFQVLVILILESLGEPATSPIEVTPTNAWVVLYELLNASVYEEFAFRLVLMGVPMAAGSLVLRVLELNRSGGFARGSRPAGRHLAGSLRYLAGGALRRTSPREAHIAAWAVLLASSAVFGAAHAPGWGWWKVLPSFVAGLAFGYLFLRHGVTAAVLAHFVNDYAGSLVYLEAGGLAVQILIGLLFLALAVAGAGFFAWYVLYAWRHLRELASRITGRPLPRRAAPAAAARIPEPAPAPASFAPSAPADIPPRAPSDVPPDYRPAFRAPPYGYPPVRFVCPSCGWVEARFDAGRFTCARCGRTA